MIDQFDGKYAFLSNFYDSPIPVRVGNEIYTAKTVEHAFQAAKTLLYDNPMAIRILTAETPGKAKKLGRHCRLHPDWEEVKDRVMLDLVRKKFQDPELAQKLIATGDEELIEGNWWGDRYWCVCEGQGQNKLGNILMKIRKELKEVYNYE